MPRKAAAKPEAAALRKQPARGKKAPAAAEEEEPDDLVDEEPPAARKSPAPAKRMPVAAARKPAPAKMPPVAAARKAPEEDEPAAPPKRGPAPAKRESTRVIQLLNQSLAWELRAQAMYAHYATYVKGLEMLTLARHFESEVTESLGHAKQVRDIIAALGGEAVTTRDDAEIVHTEDTRVMLEEALKTESAADAAYRKIVPLVKNHPVYYHAIYHILKDEADAVIEVEALLGR
ncbi:MAG TPA: ferritin-like domain-containing protein [Candidatus Eisenbacteria bacterium]|jgi:bacterioferritin (cytochrome b1)